MWKSGSGGPSSYRERPRDAEHKNKNKTRADNTGKDAAPDGLRIGKSIVWKKRDLLLNIRRTGMDGAGILKLSRSGDTLHGPLEAVRTSGRRKREESADRERRGGEHTKHCGARKTRGRRLRCKLKHFRTGIQDEAEDGTGDQAFNRSDGDVNRLHSGDKRSERELCDARSKRLERNRERPELQCHDIADDACREHLQT